MSKKYSLKDNSFYWGKFCGLISTEYDEVYKRNCKVVELDGGRKLYLLPKVYNEIYNNEKNISLYEDDVLSLRKLMGNILLTEKNNERLK